VDLRSTALSTHFLGHSTVLLELAGVRVLTDPVLSPRVTMLRRVADPVVPDLHERIDCVLISHLHADHLHLRSLRLLGDDVPLVVPVGAGEFVSGKGFTDVTELQAGETHQVGPVTVTATKAVHDGNRPPFGPRAAAIGYLVEAPGGRVYFAGDTDIFPEMDDLGGLGLDLALIPVWGWGPNLGPGHLDPARAAEATRLLRPELAVPIHWGTLRPYGLGRWMHHHLTDPPHAYARHVSRLGLPSQVVITEPGERVSG
jgi:L-ascorbate metabolism protein UlaG (beta-lactamase superfamily)